MPRVRMLPGPRLILQPDCSRPAGPRAMGPLSRPALPPSGSPGRSAVGPLPARRAAAARAGDPGRRRPPAWSFPGCRGAGHDPGIFPVIVRFLSQRPIFPRIRAGRRERGCSNNISPDGGFRHRLSRTGAVQERSFSGIFLYIHAGIGRPAPPIPRGRRPFFYSQTELFLTIPLYQPRIKIGIFIASIAISYLVEAAAPAPFPGPSGGGRPRYSPSGTSSDQHSGIPMMQPVTPQSLSFPESVLGASSAEPGLVAVCYPTHPALRSIPREGPR